MLTTGPHAGRDQSLRRGPEGDRAHQRALEGMLRQVPGTQHVRRAADRPRVHRYRPEPRGHRALRSHGARRPGRRGSGGWRHVGLDGDRRTRAFSSTFAMRPTSDRIRRRFVAFSCRCRRQAASRISAAPMPAPAPSAGRRHGGIECGRDRRRHGIDGRRRTGRHAIWQRTNGSRVAADGRSVRIARLDGAMASARRGRAARRTRRRA